MSVSKSLDTTILFSTSPAFIGPLTAFPDFRVLQGCPAWFLLRPWPSFLFLWILPVWVDLTASGISLDDAVGGNFSIKVLILWVMSMALTSPQALQSEISSFFLMRMRISGYLHLGHRTNFSMKWSRDRWRSSLLNSPFSMAFCSLCLYFNYCTHFRSKVS